MTQKDKEFLKELQEELLSADNDFSKNDSQASPRYWGIMERVLVPCSDDEGEEFIYDSNRCETYTIEEYVDLITDDLPYYLKYEWDTIDKNYAFNIVEFVNDNHISNCEIVHLKKEDKISHNAMFITKRAAQKHIELNHYHYEEPRTYAMTAWRSPEFERFLEIFKKLDISKIETDD